MILYEPASTRASAFPSAFLSSAPEPLTSVIGVKYIDRIFAKFLNTDPAPVCLQDILKQRANSRPSRNLVFYSSEDLETRKEVSYRALYGEAKQRSITIQAIKSFDKGQPVLLHLHDQRDTLVWFWAVLLANGLPVLSSPLSNVDGHRHKYLGALSNLFGSLVCITREKLLPSFDGPHTLQIKTVEFLLKEGARHKSMSLDDLGRSHAHSSNGKFNDGSPLAMLMLTSGSTGNPKAVCLTHKQLLAAIKGKASVRRLPKDRAFLNWIGLDHVASLVEIHLQSLWLGVDQIHIDAASVVSSPRLFLDLLSRHRVSRSFAPNFFLAKLISTMEADPGESTWDLSSLTVLASGGELNDTSTCQAASKLLARYGAPRNVITTGFGMTETCAGAIFNLQCPDIDIKNNRPVASLGKCMKGIEMQVTVATHESSSGGRNVRLAMSDEPGDLEVRGDVVFKGYYRDAKATAEAFTPDGWFRTGDQATIDSDGNLHLIGRVKDVFNINGVKIGSSNIQTAIEQAINAHVVRVACFPSRSAHTEQVTVAYIPREWPMAAEEMAEIENLAAQACIISTSSRPLVFPLLEESLSALPTSSLGKISRSKMTSLFESGVFARDVMQYRQVMQAFQQQKQDQMLETVQGATAAEMGLIGDFIETLNVPPHVVGVDTRVFDLGSTSMDLMRLKRCIENRLKIAVPIIMLMKNATPRSLADSLQLNSHVEPRSLDAAQPETSVASYDPVIALRSGGIKTPLWLVHPGVGEVLVFVGLAQHLTDDDRPVYALRARGFEPGQERFASISEAVETYMAAIRQRQPHGPYAIAGYSYGTMLAFEISKALNSSDGDSAVQFMGSFNLPPHIKSRMRHLNWNICLLHLSWFLDLTSDDFTDSVGEHQFRELSRDDALKRVLGAASRARLEELGLGDSQLARWTDVAFGLQSMAVDYDPSGKVGSIDVFHAIPLKVAAPSREEWLENHLGKWRDFSKDEPRFHEVAGAHYTMIGPDHVSSFSTALKAALRDRGL